MIAAYAPLLYYASHKTKALPSLTAPSNLKTTTKNKIRRYAIKRLPPMLHIPEHSGHRFHVNPDSDHRGVIVAR